MRPRSAEAGGVAVDCGALEPLLISEFAQPPVAADLLLGAGRLRQAQVVNQADVLMLHLLVPEEVAPGSLGPNLAHYGPRTAHGSSLSPAVHAALLARAGQPDQGLALLKLACRLDLDDLTGTTAQGLDLATLAVQQRHRLLHPVVAGQADVVADQGEQPQKVKKTSTSMPIAAAVVARIRVGHTLSRSPPQVKITSLLVFGGRSATVASAGSSAVSVMTLTSS